MGTYFGSVEKLLQRRNVAVRQVNDMDVVPHLQEKPDQTRKIKIILGKKKVSLSP